MMSVLFSSFLGLAILTVASGAPSEDLIVALPGLKSPLPWKQYSGYLNGTDKKHLHYWYLESSSSTQATDPLVLWMNGGPGCSSDLGLLSEHGPFRVAPDGKTLTLNPYSWNKIANMLYLEAPAGVGFSYADDKEYKTNDDEVSLYNYMALKDFFRKFPELTKNEFFITGESYGGIYVPTLSQRVIKDPSINFQGFAVGNGISDYGMNTDSLVYFAYNHGLIGQKIWEDLGSCCGGNLTRCTFHSNPSKSPMCGRAISEVETIVGMSGLNAYNLYAKCESNKAGVWFDKETNAYTYSLFPWHYHRNPEYKKQLKFVQHLMSQGHNLRLTPPCLNYNNVIKYMRSKETRKALHIPDNVQAWDICSAVVGAQYKTLYQSMKIPYIDVLNKGKRILVYNGDVDMACNFLGDEWFTDDLNLKVKVPRKIWKTMVEDGTLQVAGFVKQFENLTVVTVRGAGHMVPTDKPSQALYMFTNFIQNKPYMS
ncbi:lysosomal protective protein-like [Saccostrea echinata]|uniref:lysosomal protective protein-like n=1 Tax=Saccostrea echinata TaxID=191078 RepID=UPI002A8238B0|nr:lysosomal protective protein-like [Saccostrea echinata]